jgi:hypothetical protein
MTSFWRALCDLPTRFLPRRKKRADWMLYKLDGHPPSEFYADIFSEALDGETLHLLTDDDFEGRDTKTTPFVYVGHGTPEGAFSSIGYTAGLRDYLCDHTHAERFAGTPHIWWACYTAVWLQKSPRDDWFGYSTLIGADPRGGQEKWWRDSLAALIRSVVAVSRGREMPQSTMTVALKMHADARHQYYAARSVSWVSVLCARAYATGATWHEKFKAEDRV